MVLNKLVGEDAVLRLAMIELVNKNIDKFKIFCTGCYGFHNPKDMQLKKAPGKLRMYLSGRCNKCRV